MIVSVMIIAISYLGMCYWFYTSKEKALAAIRESEGRVAQQIDIVQVECSHLATLLEALKTYLEAKMQEQSVVKRADPVCSPSNDSKEFIYLYHKSDGRFEGSRAIGHPDIASGQYDAKWPNGEQVQCLTS